MVLEIPGGLFGQRDQREGVSTNTNVAIPEYTVSATAPANPIEGDLWYDTTTDTLKVSTEA